VSTPGTSGTAAGAGGATATGAVPVTADAAGSVTVVGAAAGGGCVEHAAKVTPNAADRARTRVRIGLPEYAAVGATWHALTAACSDVGLTL
jgi:hypothetical protein